MGMNERTYSSIANNLAKDHLQGLLDSKNNPRDYRVHMQELGKLLAEYIDEDTANDLLKTFYNITKENAEKKLEEFKNHLERK